MNPFFSFGPGGFPGFGGPLGPSLHPEVSFMDTFRCYSMVFFSNASSKKEADYGGKIILPSSALERLARLNISYPMLFQLTNLQHNRSTHCGVLEFSAEEGRMHVPRWVLQHLYAQDGDIIQVRNVSLPLATYSKFQPQTENFLDITNPKAVLELKLRLFACLTKDDLIQINYNDKIYELLVMNTEPQNAVSIIECDMKVDFAPPPGYTSPVPKAVEEDDMEDQVTQEALDAAAVANGKFKAFFGEGKRLDGKTKNLVASSDQLQPSKREKGIPNYNHRRGRITFPKAKNLKTASEEAMEEGDSGFVAFSGTGQKLKTRKKPVAGK